MRQGSCPLVDGAVVVMDVWGRNQVKGMEGLVVAVLVVAVVQVDQPASVVQSGGRAGGTRLLHPEENSYKY